MIIPVIAAAVVGALAANRNQPRTRCEQKVVLGARTGRTYQVEEFPEAGFMIVRAPDAYGVFQHVTVKAPGDARFSWRGGKGPSESLHGMCLDLGLVKDSPSAAIGPRPSAVGQSRGDADPDPNLAESRKPEASSPPQRPTIVPNPKKTGS